MAPGVRFGLGTDACAQAADETKTLPKRAQAMMVFFILSSFSYRCFSLAWVLLGTSFLNSRRGHKTDKIYYQLYYTPPNLHIIRIQRGVFKAIFCELFVFFCVRLAILAAHIYFPLNFTARNQNRLVRSFLQSTRHRDEKAALKNSRRSEDFPDS